LAARQADRAATIWSTVCHCHKGKMSIANHSGLEVSVQKGHVVPVSLVRASHVASPNFKETGKCSGRKENLKYLVDSTGDYCIYIKVICVFV